MPTRVFNSAQVNLNTAPTLGNQHLRPFGKHGRPAGLHVADTSAGQFTDPTSSSRLSGVAVVKHGRCLDPGVWQYSSDGLHWADVGSVNDSGGSLALSAAMLVRFCPPPISMACPRP